MVSSRTNTDYELFLLRIAASKHPVTGEALPPGSPWRHAEITEAVLEILSIHDEVSASTEIETSPADVGTPAKIAKLLLEFSPDQVRIWNTIEERAEGIAFAEICHATKFSVAKVQGDLDAISRKARSLFGEDYSVLKKRNGRYFPTGIEAEKKLRETQPSDYHQRITRIKQNFPNAYEPWDDEQEAKLVALWKENCSTSQIAKAMGRQPGSIRSRINKLGLFEIYSDGQQEVKADEDSCSDLEKVLIEEASEQSLVRCDECDNPIPTGRLKAVMGTTKCVNCASRQPFEKKRVQETWGTREDYKKDRQSWKPWRRK